MAAGRRSFSYNVNLMTQTTAPLRVQRAATVICLRRAKTPLPSVLTREGLGVIAEDVVSDSNQDGRIGALFGDAETATLKSGWEILMGQREAINWLRSTPERTVPMRYPGIMILSSR